MMRNDWRSQLMVLIGLGIAVIPALAADETSTNAVLSKITFDLDRISPTGLIGREGSWRSLSYEFCIPRQPETLTEVQSIDPSLHISRSPGRIGCRADQYLCIGETRQPQWRDILLQLVRLDYIERIDEFYGE
jgi:hypothetical protein